MKIKLNDIDVTLSLTQLEQAHREWEGMQKDKPKIGDWVVCLSPGVVRFGRVTHIDGGGECWAENGLIGYPGGITKNGNPCERVARKATEAEIAFYLATYPDLSKA